VDSGSLEEIEELVIRDRQHLSEDGVVVPIIAIDKHTGRLESQPEIVTRGFMPSENGQELIAAPGKSSSRPWSNRIRRKKPTGRDQGKDSRRPAALPQEANFEAAIDPSCDPRIVSPQRGVFPTQLRSYRASDFETLYRIDQVCFPEGIAYGRFEMKVYLRAEDPIACW